MSKKEKKKPEEPALPRPEPGRGSGAEGQGPDPTRPEPGRGSEAEGPAPAPEPAPAPLLPPPTEEELAALREKAAKADEFLDLARRTKADFSNYQDRVRREKGTWRRQALEDFVAELLPAMDGFALATFEDPKLLEAIRLLEKEFLRLLAKQGVVPIGTEGKTFDPAYHEAVAVEEREDKADGEIVAEVRRGWLIDGHVIRAAAVRIAKAPAAPAAPEKDKEEDGGKPS